MSENSNYFKDDFVGIFKSPGATLGRLMERRSWLMSFTLILLVLIVFTYIVTPIQVKQMAENPDISEEVRSYMMNYTVLSRLMTGCMAGLMFFLVTGVGAFFLYLFFGVSSCDGVYGNYFSLAMNGAIVGTLIPTVLNTVLLLLGVGMMASPHLGLLVPGLDVKGFLYQILGGFDIFSIWYIWIVSLGVAVFAKETVKKCLTVGGIYFLFKVLVGAAFAYIRIKTIGM